MNGLIAAVAKGLNTRLLRSCPGSGKTRAIVAKTLECIGEVEGTTRRVACITYTNAAVEEIEERLRIAGTTSDADYYEIGTIHSFCLNYILGTHRHLLKPFKEGIDVVSVESPWFRTAAEQIVGKHKLKAFALERLAEVHREPDGSLFYPDGVTLEAATDFITRADKEGKVTFGDIVYFSTVLLSNYAYISRGVASRFAWLLIDEFQDTSTAQVEILKNIFDHGHTRLLLVGDPNQSIYGFAGAKPQLMDEIAKYTKAETNITLSGNYRCSARIVSAAERICKALPTMQAIGPTKECPLDPIYVNTTTFKEGILGAFIPALQRTGIPFGEAAILSPQWFILFQLARELRKRGFPVYGPGARPYRRSLEFAQLAEHACAYAKCRDPGVLTGAQKALYIMILNLTGESRLDLYRYEGKKILVRLLNTLTAMNQQYIVATQWLNHAAAATAAILIEAELLDARSAVKLMASAKAMIELTEDNLRKDGVDPATFTTDALGMFAKPTECIQLMTLHTAKGKEFDAVAIVDLHEDVLPHWSAKSAEAISESARLLYVGITRARKLLMLLTHTASKKSPSRFLGKGYLELR